MGENEILKRGAETVGEKCVQKRVKRGKRSKKWQKRTVFVLVCSPRRSPEGRACEGWWRGLHSLLVYIYTVG